MIAFFKAVWKWMNPPQTFQHYCPDCPVCVHFGPDECDDYLRMMQEFREQELLDER